LSVTFSERQHAETERAHPPRWASAAILLALSMIALQIGRGLTNGEGLKWDFANFYDAGHKAAAGEAGRLYDQTATIAGERALGEMSFLGTPLSAVLYAPLSWFSPETALVLFKLQHTIATAAALVLLFQLHRRTARMAFASNREFVAVFALAAAVYQPFWEVYHVGGQSTGAVFLALASGTLWYTRGQQFLAALAFALAVAVKPALVAPLVVLSWLSGRRFTAYAASIGALLALASVWWAGWSAHVVFLERVLATNPESWRFNSSVTVALDNLQTMPASPLAPAVTSVASTVIRLGAAGGVIACAARVRSRLRSVGGQRHLNIIVAITAGLLVLPVVWEHYLALLFIPLSYYLAVCRRLPRRARGLVTVIFVAALVQNVAVISRIRSVIYVNSVPELVAAGLLKSAALTLTAILLVAYLRELMTASEDGWDSAAGTQPLEYRAP
jgi:hypothetical protein